MIRHLCAACILAATIACSKAELYVIGGVSRSILQVDETAGTVIHRFGSAAESFEGVTFGPDGNIYVSSNTLGYGEVVCFGPDGSVRGVFASTGMHAPGPLAFGPDGDLYVLATTWTDLPIRGQVLRYDGTNGMFKGWFVAPDALSLGQPTGLSFAPNGDLFVSDLRSGILQFQAGTGQFVGPFHMQSGISNITALVVALDESLYVTSRSTNAVFRFQASAGQLINVFTGETGIDFSQTRSMTVGRDGILYISGPREHTITRLDTTTGISLQEIHLPQEPMPKAIVMRD